MLAQTYADFEYVIQDGASTDGTTELLRQYGDPRIRLQSEADGGPADAFWRTLARCRGDYVCACLSDEELLPRAVEEAVAALDADPDAVALTRDAYLTDLDGCVLETARGRCFDLIEYLANRFAPNFAAAMFRRDALEAAGLGTRSWDLDCGEFELWYRLARVGPIRYLPGVAAKYGIHDGQLSQMPENAVRLARGRLRTIDRIARQSALFHGRPELLTACRVATALSFARHLCGLGASVEAAGLYMSVTDESGRLPEPRAGETPAAEYIQIARAQRLVGRPEVALAVLETAARLTNHDASIPFEIAQAHAAAGRIDRALAMYDAAIGLAPDCLEAHWERGLLLERRGQIDEALEAWRHSDVTRDPRRHSLYLVACLKSPRSTNRSLFVAHREWARHHAVRPYYFLEHRFPAWQPGDRVTVGYACSFWDADTITFQLLPMLRRHDRRRFKVIAYARTEPGPLVTASVDEVCIVSALANDDYVRRVREDRVHILVEINGHSPGHWFAAMAARCAPIQVSYLNYTSTCGVEQVDYVMGDAISVPPGTDIFFTEKVYRLPGCFFCFTYDDAVLPAVGSAPSLASGPVTFGCFGSGGKINPELLDLWAEILRRVPDSRLLIMNAELTPADNRQALARAFAHRGIACDRLLIRPGATRQRVLESYAQVDISLDTFPYCGGNTIAESLWQGVPVVTRKGDRFSSAYGASLLTASGVPELIADTAEEYVHKAVALAGDANRLTYYRANLRTFVKRFGFSDADAFTTNLEAAYLDMLARRNQRDSRAHWRDALALLASSADDRDIREEWRRRFGGPEFAGLNRALRDIGSGGLGLDNAGDPETTGERWLLGQLAALFADVDRPVVFDVGAHEGELATEILRLIPRAKLHAFEPIGKSFGELAVALAGTDAAAVQQALGASPGTLRLHDHRQYGGGTVHASAYPGLFTRYYGTESTHQDVQVTTLDDYCGAWSVGRIDLLKIDTEGSELQVLRGAQALLAAGRVRVVLFEFNYTHIFSRTFFSDFFEVLPAFVFFRLLPAGLMPLPRGDWNGTEVFRYQNIVALPESNREDVALLTRDTHA